MANFKSSRVCVISVIFGSACRFVEFNTSIIVFGSFLFHYMFLNLQVFAFEGQNMTLTVNVLLTCILNRDTWPEYD